MTGWQCGLRGKHPASAEYLALGPAAERLAGVFSWIRTGFTVPVLRRLAASPTPVAWHFWILPEGERRLICGFFTASRDCCGRPYPLLVAGIASPAAPVAAWDQLAPACRPAWAKLAAITTEERLTTGDLEAALAGVPAPQEQRPGAATGAAPTALMIERAAEHVAAGRASRCIGIRIGSGRSDRWQRFLEWQGALAQLVPIAPYSLFFCEPADDVELFYRPLDRTDGIRLIALALDPPGEDLPGEAGHRLTTVTPGPPRAAPEA